MARLGDIFTISSGGTPDKRQESYYAAGTIPWVKTGDLKKKYVPHDIECITKEGLENSSAKLFPVGTVLVAMYGATIGACSILDFEASTNQACAAFLPTSKVLPEYLYYFLCSKKEVFTQNGVGGTQPNISAGYLKKFPFDVISLDIQRQIVLILNKVSALISLRRQQLAKLDELVKARFVEMFGDPVGNPLKWDTPILSDCMESIENGKSFVCESEPRKGEWPAVLKLSAVTYGVFQAEENKAVLDIEDFVPTAEIHADDLLFTRKNTPELVGMSAYVFETEPFLMMPDLIFRLNTNEKCNKIFIWQLINHDLFRLSISNLASGSAKSMSNISKERLANLKIICPPIELQCSFAEFVRQNYRQKLTIQQSLDKLEILKKSLMQEYFM